MKRRRTQATLLDAALGYAGRGIPVFPCAHPVGTWRPEGFGTPACSCEQLACLHPGEHPMDPNWQEEASTDPATIQSWWRLHPEANVGLRTGVVFDVLDADDGSGARALRRLGGERRASVGPVARTGGGRWHFFVASTGGGDTVVPTGRGTRPGHRPRVHWHGRGGYVVAAPSRHVNGDVTRWVRSLDAPLPDASALLPVLLGAT